MERKPLSERVKLIKVKDPTTDGTSAVNGDGVDMQQDGGWEGVMFFTSFATPAAGNLMNAAQSANNTDFDDLADSQVDAGASDEDQWVDVFRPSDRYVRPELVRGTSTVVGDIWAMLYGPRQEPTTNVLAGTINGKCVIEPLEGTA